MHHKWTSLLWIVVLLLLASCSRVVPATSSPVLIPTRTPYPTEIPGEVAIHVPEEIQSQIVELYQSKFGFSVPSPIVGRYDVNIAAENRWVSAAYLGDRLYEIDLFDDGHVESKAAYVNAPDPERYSSYCLPRGNYRILVVVVDYQNTGFTFDQVRQSLMDGAARLNARYAEYATSVGLSSPIFSVNVESVYLRTAPNPGGYVNFGDVLQLTGVDPAAYDLVGQVDLDMNMSVAGDTGAGGFARNGCNGSTNTSVNMWEGVRDAFSLEWLAGTLLDHELAHIMGWQHWWPRWDGSLDFNMGQNAIVWPVYMFGWLDSDNDGVVEINDPTPYGTIQ